MNLRDTINWHKGGLVTAPRAMSVRHAQVLIGELLTARALIRDIAERSGPYDPMTPEGWEFWKAQSDAFLERTDDLEQFANA